MINDFLVVRGQFNTRLFEGGLFMVGIAPVPLNALWSSHNTYIQLNIDKCFEMCGHAIRGIIAILYNRERTMAEIEGRLIGKLVPILETRLKEYYSTEEYKALIRALMDDILNEECDGNE